MYPLQTGGARWAPAQPTAREGGRTASFVRMGWWLPDLGMVASCVTLFYCLFLFEGYQKLFRDSDAGWHIRTGESILATGVLPRTDPYSFTRAGQPWFAWEWGADVLTGAAHRLAGLSGVALLYGAAIAAGVWLWFRLHWIVGGNFLLAAALAAPMLSTCNIHWLARPHVLSWMFLLLAVAYAETASPPFSRRHFRTIALFSALWANVHASFFFAPLIALIYAAGHAARPLIWDSGGAADGRKAAWFCQAAAVSAASSLLNPYGWDLHRHLFRYLTDAELLRRVGEFQSFDFHAPGALQILLALAVAALGGVLALGQRRLDHFLLAALAVGSALRSARGLPLAALLLLPIANAAITRALQDASGLHPRLRAGLGRFLAYSAGLRALDRRLNGLALAPLVLLVCFGLLRAPGVAARTGFPPDQFPAAAAAELEKIPHARLLAPDKFGGYLIYRFQGRLKVFFDGRSDLYGAEFLKQYGRLVQVRPGWREQLDALEFTHALLPNDYSLIPALEEIGWRVLYRDSAATLLAKPAEVARHPGTCCRFSGYT